MKLALAIAFLASNALACSVPVFRYALEHWAADPYQVEIAHQGPLSASEQELVKKLTDAKLPNIAVKQVESAEATPRVIVKHPASLKGAREVWSAPLDAATIGLMLDSPIRQEIAAKLGEGESAIWLLLESGDKAADDTAATALDQHLKRMSETLELPKLDAQDIKNGLVSVPEDGLRLSFHIIRLARDNPAEQFLVKTLLATEPDLADLKGPIAFPIFGRGRVLYALVGKGINADNIGHAANFLIGSCSCQIKEQNPGVDLVMSADWKKLLKADNLLDETLPKLSEIEGLKPILVPIPDRANKDLSPEKSPSYQWIAAILTILVVILGFQYARRSKADH